VQTTPPALNVSVPAVIFPAPSAVKLPNPATGESAGGVPVPSKKPWNLVEYVPLRLESLKTAGVGVAVGDTVVAVGDPGVGRIGGWP
jgi:hypothetical protein